MSRLRRAAMTSGRSQNEAGIWIRSLASASDRGRPLVTGVNGPLMARRASAWPVLSFMPYRCSDLLDCLQNVRPSTLNLAAYTGVMSVQREELLRLVEELPEEEVPAALDDIRRHLRSVRDRPWPPAWFGAGESSADDVAARSEDLLGDGFGHSA